MLLSGPECQKLLDALVLPVQQAGDKIMAIHARGVVAREKPDGSPVSEADEAAEDKGKSSKEVSEDTPLPLEKNKKQAKTHRIYSW